MLPRSLRFTSRIFDRVFRRSERWRRGDFVFLVSKARGQARLSIVVGKKISKSAVKRNRLRRQLYAALEKHGIPRELHHNVICLYKGNENLHNASALDPLLDAFVRWCKQR